MLNLLASLQAQLSVLLKKTEPTGLYPKVERARDALIKRMATLGYPIRVTSEYRSPMEQDKLYAQGRTAPGPVVTNARGGQSYHNWHCAFDVVFRIQGYDGPWALVAKEGKAQGFEWGGDWTGTLVDKPHFQMTLGYSLSDFANGKVDTSKYT